MQQPFYRNPVFAFILSVSAIVIAIIALYSLGITKKPDGDRKGMGITIGFSGIVVEVVDHNTPVPNTEIGVYDLISGRDKRFAIDDKGNYRANLGNPFPKWVDIVWAMLRIISTNQD